MMASRYSLISSCSWIISAAASYGSLEKRSRALDGTCTDVRSDKSRIIGISGAAAPIAPRRVGRRQRLVEAQAVHEIRLADERSSEGHHVCCITGNCGKRHLKSISIIDDPCAILVISFETE